MPYHSQHKKPVKRTSRKTRRVDKVTCNANYGESSLKQREEYLEVVRISSSKSCSCWVSGQASVINDLFVEEVKINWT